VDAKRGHKIIASCRGSRSKLFFPQVSSSPSRGAPDRIRSLIIIIRTLCNQCNGAMTFQNFFKLLMIIIITDQGALTSKRPSCTCYKSIKRSIWPRIRRDKLLAAPSTKMHDENQRKCFNF
jgi:hypothetical protein